MMLASQRNSAPEAQPGNFQSHRAAQNSHRPINGIISVGCSATQPQSKNKKTAVNHNSGSFSDFHEQKNKTIQNRRSNCYDQ